MKFLLYNFLMWYVSKQQLFRFLFNWNSVWFMRFYAHEKLYRSETKTEHKAEKMRRVNVWSALKSMRLSWTIHNWRHTLKSNELDTCSLVWIMTKSEQYGVWLRYGSNERYLTDSKCHANCTQTTNTWIMNFDVCVQILKSFDTTHACTRTRHSQKKHTTFRP